MQNNQFNAEIIIENIKKYSVSQNVQITIKDEIRCCRKLQLFLEGGLKTFQVISDFDRTLSRYNLNGRSNPTCHGVFETDPELTAEMREQYDNLRKHYIAIEFNPLMTNKEKLPFMEEWWTKGHKLIVNSHLHRSVLQRTVANCELELRDDADEFMKRLETYKVPLLLFSAGIGDVIEEVLRNKNLLLDNVKIVSNFMEFDSEDIICGFNKEIIHSFNKTAYSIQDSEYWENVCDKRNNVLLLGDSTGDPHMSDGLNKHDADISSNVLKIGFLNNNASNLMTQYSEIYDIVIVSDETFGVPLLIFKGFQSI